MNEVVWLNDRAGFGARLTNRLLRLTRSRQPLDVSDDQALIAAREKLEGFDTFMARLRRSSALPFVAREAWLADVPVVELMVKQPLAPQDNGVLLFIHGGGFFFRSLHAHKLLAARIAQEAGIGRVILPLYALAPEQHFPVARNQCQQVYTALLASGAAADRIAVAADSAGAALALGMVGLARVGGFPLPRGIALMSPLLDLSYSGASIDANAQRDPMFGGMAMPVPSYYLGDVAPGDPACSPLFANMDGWPPLYVQVGSTERLLDDSLRLAEAGRVSGVPVMVEVWPDMPHVFQAYDFREAVQARRTLARFLRQSSGGAEV